VDDKRDIQTIVKEAAERYGLDYDEKQSEMTVKLNDGTFRIVSKEDFEKTFN
jgi:hypothetical protein